MIAPIFSKAQNTCSSSSDITDTLILVNDSSAASWFKFSSNTGNKLIDINNWNSSLDSIIIYSGSCNQLNTIISYTIDSGYNRYFIPNTTIGITYYLSVYKNQTDTFSIYSFDAFNKSSCESSTCNLINNGGFEQGLIAPTLYTFQLINNSYESIVPCWFSAKNKDICGSEFTNSYYAQILDKSYSPTFVSSCSNPSTTSLGIPTNYVSDGVLNTYDFYDPTNLNSNNRYVSMHHVLSEIVVSLNNPVYQGKYILEYDFGITHCYNFAPYRLYV